MDQEVRDNVSNALEQLIESMPGVVSRVITDNLYIGIAQSVTNDMKINGVIRPKIESYILVDFQKKMIPNKDLFYQHLQQLYGFFTRPEIKWYRC